jgi:hypothetical protein
MHLIDITDATKHLGALKSNIKWGLETINVNGIKNLQFLLYH